VTSHGGSLKERHEIECSHLVEYLGPPDYFCRAYFSRKSKASWAGSIQMPQDIGQFQEEAGPLIPETQVS